MNESPVAREWRAEARREGEIKGEIRMLVRVLQRRLESLPDDMVSRIQACMDGEQLERWMDLAATATTLAEFRREASL